MKLSLKSDIAFNELLRNLNASALLADAIDNGTRSRWERVQYGNTEFTVEDKYSTIKVEKKIIPETGEVEVVVTCSGDRDSLAETFTAETFQKLKALYDEGVLKIVEYRTKMPWLSPWDDHKTAGQHPMTVETLKIIHTAYVALKEAVKRNTQSIIDIQWDFNNRIEPLVKKHNHDESCLGYSTDDVWQEWFGSTIEENHSITDWLTEGDNMKKLPHINPAKTLIYYLRVDRDDE